MGIRYKIYFIIACALSFLLGLYINATFAQTISNTGKLEINISTVFMRCYNPQDDMTVGELGKLMPYLTGRNYLTEISYNNLGTAKRHLKECFK